VEMAPAVAELMALELGWDDAEKVKQLSSFGEVAEHYRLR